MMKGSQCAKLQSNVLPGFKQIIARYDYIYAVARKEKDKLQLSLINPLTMQAKEEYTIDDQSQCELTHAAGVLQYTSAISYACYSFKTQEVHLFILKKETKEQKSFNYRIPDVAYIVSFNDYFVP